MPCPFGVDIPINFKYWNNAYIYEEHEVFKEKLENMESKKKAENCKQCGACEKMCPQQLSIRKDLRQVCNYIDD